MRLTLARRAAIIPAPDVMLGAHAGAQMADGMYPLIPHKTDQMRMTGRFRAAEAPS